MKLIVKTNQQAEANANQRDLTAPITSFNIPNSTITWITIIYLIVNSLSAAIGSIITNNPQRELDKLNYILKEKNFKVQLLQRILELDSLQDRKSAIQLFIHADLLNNNGELLKFIEGSKYICKFPKRAIEPLNSYWSNYNTSYPITTFPNTPATTNLIQVPFTSSTSTTR